MLALSSREKFRRIIFAALAVTAVAAFAISSYAIASNNMKEIRAACMAKAQKLQTLRDARTPLLP